jgi:hypothetical protein
VSTGDRKVIDYFRLLDNASNYIQTIMTGQFTGFAIELLLLLYWIEIKFLAATSAHPNLSSFIP